jgi:hypothetical protein
MLCLFLEETVREEGVYFSLRRLLKPGFSFSAEEMREETICLAPMTEPAKDVVWGPYLFSRHFCLRYCSICSF